MCVCVCVVDKCGFATHTFVREGCVKIMQIWNECEIKNWLITPDVSIWLHLGSSLVIMFFHHEGLVPVGQPSKNVLYSNIAEWDSAICALVNKIKYKTNHAMDD